MSTYRCGYCNPPQDFKSSEEYVSHVSTHKKVCNKRICNHQKRGKTWHCAEMSCENYVNKCPVHSIPKG